MDRKGIIYKIYWKNCAGLQYFYELEDAIEWCKTQIDKEFGHLYNNIKYCVDKDSDRYCFVGHNGGYGEIMDYEIRTIDVY